MSLETPPELFWLGLTCLATALFWAPYILLHIAETGLIKATGDPSVDTTPKAAWGVRAKKAHYNAIENLAIFAPLAIGVVLTGAASSTTALACAIYFFARIAHFVVATLGVPFLRTGAFFVGVGAQITLALALIG